MNFLTVDALQLAALVPVPPLPQRPPPTTDNSTLGWVLAVLFIASVMTFATIVVRGELGFRRKNELTVLAWVTLAVFLLFGATYAEWRTHHFRQDAEWAAWSQDDLDARDQAQRAIERTYGLTFEGGNPTLPLTEYSWADDEVVVLSDGTQETCWFRVVDGHYDVRCGDVESDAQPLSPVSAHSSASP